MKDVNKNEMAAVKANHKRHLSKCGKKAGRSFTRQEKSNSEERIVKSSKEQTSILLEKSLPAINTTTF